MAFQILGANGRSLGAGYGTGWVPYSRFCSKERDLVLPWRRAFGGEPALSLLHLVAVSIPVKQVGAGGHWGGD